MSLEVYIAKEEEQGTGLAFFVGVVRGKTAAAYSNGVDLGET